jgi:hypothetical protein
MKNWKKIVALLVVLAVFAAVFIVLKKTDNGSSPTDTSSPDDINKVDLVEFAQEDITKIILKRPDGEITLNYEEREVETLKNKDDGTTERVKEKKKIWVSPDLDLDNTKGEDIALSGAIATTMRLIEENPQDPTIYGLNGSYITTFVSKDGKQVGLEMGDENPAGDAFYVRVVGDTKVYVIDTYRGNILRFGRLDIMNRNLYGTEAILTDDITSLALTKGGTKIFEGRKQPDNPDWMITYPVERKADATDISKFLQWIPEMRVYQFVSEGNSDLKTYGLDNPKYILEYTLIGKTYSLKLGNLEDSLYYAMLDGDPRIFKLSSSAMNFLDLPAIDVMDTFAYIPMIYDVEKLVIEMDGRVDELLINASRDDEVEETFIINGTKMEGDKQVSLFRKYYQGAIAIQGDRLDLNAVPTGKAEIKLTYTMKVANPDKVVVVELIPTPDGYGYYLVVNGEYTGMAMGKRLLDKTDMGIRQAYTNLMEGLKEASESQ